MGIWYQGRIVCVTEGSSVNSSTCGKSLIPESSKQPSAPNARIYRGKYAINRNTLKAWYVKNQKGTQLEGLAFTETNAFALLKIKSQEAKTLRQEQRKQNEDHKREAVLTLWGTDSVPLVTPSKPNTSQPLQPGILRNN